jgi:hypothetical protein
VPANKFKISDITIAGQNIQFAGQIAQRVFVKLTAAIGPQNEIKNRPRSPCTGGPAAHAAAAARPGLHTRTRRTR